MYLSPPGCCVEAQIVNLADQIAWVTHDLEDALRVRFFTVDEIGELDIYLLRTAWERALVGAPSWERDRILWARLLVRNMIDLLISDVLAVSTPRLAKAASVEEIMAPPRAPGGFFARDGRVCAGPQADPLRPGLHASRR